VLHYRDDGASHGKGEVTYVHEVGDKRLPLGALQIGPYEMLYEAIPQQDWIEKATAAGLNPGVAALIETTINEKDDYPMLWKGVYKQCQ
jgi:hypothetical protein